MPGLLDFGQTDEEKHQNQGLLAALAGMGILGANGPNVAPGQAIGAGALSGFNAFANQQALQQRQKLQAAQMQMAQDRLVPNAIREYEYAKGQGFQGTFEDYRNQVMGRNEVPSNIREWEYFNKLTPEEQTRYLTMKRAINPINLGGSVIQPNPAVPGGPPVATYNKTPPPEQMPEFKGAQSRESAAGKVQGTTQATAAVNLRDTVAQAQQSINLIDSILSDPAMPNVIGVPESLSGVTSKLGMPVAGSPEAGFVAKIDQLRGRQFLQAFNDLRGGGQITEAEGAKATDAISRMMKTNQSESEYLKAAEEFKSIIKAGVERAKKKAGMVPSSGASGGWSIQRVD